LLFLTSLTCKLQHIKILAAESCDLLNGERFYMSQFKRHVSTLRAKLKTALHSNNFYENSSLLVI
jgi:hypothetical protein